MTGRTWLRNAVDVALNGAIDQTATSIVVDDATLLPDDTPFYIVIDPFNDAGREYIRVGTIDKGTDTLSDLDRNLEGTQSLIHADASVVRLSWQSQHLDDVWAEPTGVNSKAGWKGPWVQQSYLKHDMVIDGQWTMIANKDTTERAGVVPTGDPFYVYEGANPTDVDTVSQIIFGNRYPLAQDGYLNGYRIYVVTGNRYVVYLIVDPDGVREVRQLIDFTATQTGWVEFSISPTVVTAGTVLELLATVNEPDPTPTVWSDDWNYQTPQNPAVPAAGFIQHSRGQPDLFDINKTSQTQDQTAQLLALNVGDIIDGAGTSWAIQGKIDNGTYWTFVVAPALTGTPTGIQTFDFQTVTPTPITYMNDPLWWPGSSFPNVQGVFSNSGVDNIVLDTDAYGTDLLLQYASIPDDWDVVAFSGSGGGVGSGEGLTQPEADALYLRLDASNDPVTGPVTFADVLTMGADIAMGNNRVTGLAIPPTTDAEASPKKYVDDQDSAHVADADPHPQYLEPSEADAVYLKLDASNDPITGALEITAPLTVFDNKILIHDSDLNFFLDTKFQANIQLAGQSRLAFQQSEARLRFIGQTGTVIGHLYDDKTNDLPGSLLGAYFFTQSGLTLLSSGNTIVFTTAIDTAALFPGGASQVPELLVVTEGFLRQNNQPAASFQARTSIAGTSRNYGYAIGATNAASSRSSAPIPNAVRVAATAASVTVEVSARSFGSNISADLDLHVRVYAAPIGGNV